MGRHSREPEAQSLAAEPLAAEPTGEAAQAGRPEPVAVAAAVQAVLAALVTVGWVSLDSTTIAAIGTVVAAGVAALVTILARRQVTPISAPRTVDGTPLVPERQ